MPPINPDRMASLQRALAMQLALTVTQSPDMFGGTSAASAESAAAYLLRECALHGATGLNLDSITVRAALTGLGVKRRIASIDAWLRVPTSKQLSLV